MPEDNGLAPQFPMTQIQWTPDNQALIVSNMLAPGLTLTQGYGPDLLETIVRGYLERHPDLLLELARESIEAKRRELQLIQHISKSRND
jgi:hypothetical protein